VDRVLSRNEASAILDALAGALVLAIGMGFGRFAFTGMYPLMVHEGQLTIASGSLAAWSVAGTNVLAVTEKISQVPDHVCISQVHLGTGPTASTKPLFELFYYANGNIVMAIEQTPAGGNEVQHTVGNVPLGTKFSYSVGLTGGNTIDFTMNGKVQTWPLTAAFQKYTMYFKAGDYDQTAGSSTTNGALLHIYALSVTHTS